MTNLSGKDALIKLGMQFISAILLVMSLLLGCGYNISGISDTASIPSAVRVTLGRPEIVMDHSRDSCRQSKGLDLPDVHARAVRTPDNNILLISGNAPVNYTMVGSDFNRLQRNCSPALISGDSPFAYSFDNQEWLWSVYREGNTIHALVHNEYHDPVAQFCKPGVGNPGNPCWYNTITYAVSTDGGRTFRHPPAPDHVVAASPRPWIPPMSSRDIVGIHGYFYPSNIVRGQDGYYYAMFFAIPDGRTPSFRGTCLMRTANLSDPKSWRAWNGEDFTIAMPSPYDTMGNPAPNDRPACAFVGPETIRNLYGGLTFNTYLGKYILLGSSVFIVKGLETCGTFFSLSSDLIAWSSPQLLLPGKLTFPPCNTGGNPDGSIIHPSLIDHTATGVNFETTGQRPYLYYVVWNRGLDRDLVRVPVTFHKWR